MRDILGAVLKHAVWLNDVLIPINSADSVLGRYTEPLIVWHENNDIYPCGLVGSSVAVRYRDRYLLLCSRHQLQSILEGRPIENVGLLDKDGKIFCSSAGMKGFKDINETDFHDLTILDFTKPCENRPHMKERFFKLEGGPPNVLSNQIVAIIVSGYPFDDLDYKLEEERHLGFRKRIIYCLPAAAGDQSADSALLRLKTMEELDFDPDGMSGGAAFTIQFEEGGPRAYFAGMVVRADSKNFYIVKAGYILQFLDMCLDQESPRS